MSAKRNSLKRKRGVIPLIKRRAAKSKRGPLNRSRVPSFVAADFLAAIGDELKYRKNQKLFGQGDIAGSLYFIQKGRVKVTIASKHGKEAVVAIIGKGDFCGEQCLSGDLRRVTSARAFTDCEVTRLNKKVFIRALRKKSALAVFFAERSLKRTIRLEEDLVDHFFNTSEMRLARALLLLAGVDKNGFSEPITLRISQRTLAEMIGTTRSRVNFFMNKFRKLGLISYDGTVTINNALLGFARNGELAQQNSTAEKPLSNQARALPGGPQP